MNQEKEHWENLYRSRDSTAVSWFQEHATLSLAIIERTRIPLAARILDVGGGTSPLVIDLLDRGYSNLAVLDISETALDIAKQRAGARASLVDWIEADITRAPLDPHSCDVWHDRAVFHFLVDKNDRRRYVETVMRAVKPGGFVIIATFAPDGPEKCSGLEVVRYDSESLHSEFGENFNLSGSVGESHTTPLGIEQRFLYCFCRKL